ncbi:rhamnan synthesis F family protein [Paraburkholderia sp. B3]|uniref:rhamnan synthesis F family protein n=1 Tax=Paraburkholderia sp. B3 TaxID=3134791 RepID=UPI003981D522
MNAVIAGASQSKYDYASKQKEHLERCVMLSKETIESLSPSSFWVPHYFCQSAWIEHAPFAFWLTDALRPKRFVELGSHYGYSYFAFCQAIERLGISTAAYAVDTWQGDEHAGFYDNSVYEAVLATNQRYAGFSRLNRATFAEAAEYFSDASIDLIHIDGRHFYDDVKEDYESWLPKLTKDAIVLFHDTNVRERGFGVWKFFEELSAKYPSFQFNHGNGLGVLARGAIPEKLTSLFAAKGSEIDQIRSMYSSLGGLLVPRRQLMAKTEAIAEMLKDGADVSANAAETLARISDWDPQIQVIRSAIERYKANALASAPAALHAAQARASELEAAIAVLNEEVAQIRALRVSEEAETQGIRRANESLRADIEASNATALELQRDNAQLQAILNECEAETATLRSAVELTKSTEKKRPAEDLRSLLAEMVIQERRHVQALSDRADHIAREGVEKDAVIASLRDSINHLSHQNVEYTRASDELIAIRNSTSWKMTLPVRRALRSVPILRTPARRVIKAIHWTATGQLFKRLAARRQALALLHAQHAPVIDAPESLEEAVIVSPLTPAEAARPIEIDYSVSVPFSFAKVPDLNSGSVAAIVHLHYEELAGEFRSYLSNVPVDLDVYISTTDSFRASVIEKAFSGWAKGSVEVRVVPNRGRDIAPKLVTFSDVYDRYAYVVHLHGKRSKHATVLSPWRHFLLENLLGTPEVVTSVLHAFGQNPKLGIIASQHFEPMRHWANWGGNFPNAEKLARRMGFSLNERDPLDFPSGSMFWARTAALKPLLDLRLKTDDFDAESNQTDATLAHAIERIFLHTCEHAGFDWIKIARPSLHENTPCIVGVPRESDLATFFNRCVFRLLDPRGVRQRTVRPNPVEKAPGHLFDYVRNRALGLHIDVKSDTRVAIGLVTYNNSAEELALAVGAAELSLKTADLSTAGSLFLLDNGASTDESIDARDLITRLPSRGNIGFGGGHNHLMRAAFDEGFDIYIAINPDGALHPDAVRALVQMVLAADGKALVEALQFPSEHPKPYDEHTLDTPWVSGACLAISKSAFADLGGFDEDFFMYCEDVDLSWRARTWVRAEDVSTCAVPARRHKPGNETDDSKNDF